MDKYNKFVGKELMLMLEKNKPMSSFCRLLSEDIDEFSSQDFYSFVKDGKILCFRFYVSESYGKVLYTVFTLPDQAWRFPIYKALKKVRSWSAEQEYLESYLLGYINMN